MLRKGSVVVLISLLRGEILQEEYLNINNVRVIYKKLPKKIYGFIHRYRNINIIVVNWNISKEKKKNALIHELAHLELHHLDENKDLLEFYIESCEDEASKYIKMLNETIKFD